MSTIYSFYKYVCFSSVYSLQVWISFACVKLLVFTFIAGRAWKQSAMRVPRRAPNMALKRVPSLAMDVTYWPSAVTSANLLGIKRTHVDAWHQCLMPGPIILICSNIKIMKYNRRGSTPVCIDARASINSQSASFHIKVHRSISKVHAHHFQNFWGSSGGDPTLGG